MGLHGDGLKDGDVILCNHPGAGGSHLPDLTIITPVSSNKHFYVYIVELMTVNITTCMVMLMFDTSWCSFLCFGFGS